MKYDSKSKEVVDYVKYRTKSEKWYKWHVDESYKGRKYLRYIYENTMGFYIHMETGDVHHHISEENMKPDKNGVYDNIVNRESIYITEQSIRESAEKTELKIWKKLSDDFEELVNIKDSLSKRKFKNRVSVLMERLSWMK